MVAKRLKPIIAVVGQTASGKSALGLELARRFNGEIICADSRTVYIGMDIGTAKPSRQEQAEIPHHMLDIETPDTAYSVADFQAQAHSAIDDIHSRGKLPIVVGGSGLYIDALLYNFQFSKESADESERQRLGKMSIDALQTEILTRGLPMPENSKNRRYLQRTLERNGQVSVEKNLLPDCIIIGLQMPAEKLKKRIIARVDMMFGQGLIAEAETLAAKYGWDNEAMKTPAYNSLKHYLTGQISELEAKNEFIQSDLKLAKNSGLGSSETKVFSGLITPDRL